MKGMALLAVVISVLCTVVAIPGAGNAAVSENNWRLNIKTDDGRGYGYGVDQQLGVSTNSSATDGVDPLPGLDSISQFAVDLTASSRWTVSTIGTDMTTVYSRNIMSTASPISYPNARKVWDIYVAAMTNADSLPIRLRFVTTSALPAATCGGAPIAFELKLIDNKGKTGAPANGTTWSIPIPTAASNTVFWSTDTAQDVSGHAWGNLPMLRVSSNTSPAWINEGYHFQFVETVVPEPASLLALGCGVVPLSLGALRRRRR